MLNEFDPQTLTKTRSHEQINIPRQHHANCRHLHDYFFIFATMRYFCLVEGMEGKLKVIKFGLIVNYKLCTSLVFQMIQSFRIQE